MIIAYFYCIHCANESCDPSCSILDDLNLLDLGGSFNLNLCNLNKMDDQVDKKRKLKENVSDTKSLNKKRKLEKNKKKKIVDPGLSENISYHKAALEKRFQKFKKKCEAGIEKSEYKAVKKLL